MATNEATAPDQALLPVSTNSSSIADSLSTLSDRGLRRLLGARTFLRGLEYARRRVVEHIAVSETSASGQVKSPEGEPFHTQVTLTSEGIKSQCTCPVFIKTQQHCKHVAALLIMVRDQARSANPRPASQASQNRNERQDSRSDGREGRDGREGQSRDGRDGQNRDGQNRDGQNRDGRDNREHRESRDPRDSRGERSGDPKLAGNNADPKNARRERRKGRTAVTTPEVVIHERPREHVRVHGHELARAHGLMGQVQPAPPADSSAKPLGLGAWLPPVGVGVAKPVEFRVLVRPGGLTVTVLDPEARLPMLPSVALSWQAHNPTNDREALRVLARLESGNPRHPAVDVRGEEVSELLPLLNGRRVLLEPTLMQLRFAEESIRPRFDLELVGDTIQAKVAFERPSDRRRFALAVGAWFEGSPGWHIDPSEGIARTIDRRVSISAFRRMMKNPVITESAQDLVPLIMDGLPKVALGVGAELPELDQIADVTDLAPTFRMQAGGSLTEVQATLTARYGEIDVPVRADGISPPIIIRPPAPGNKRFRCIRCDIPAQQQAAEQLTGLGLQPDETGQRFVAGGPGAVQFWSEGVAQLPKEWSVYVPQELANTEVRHSPLKAFAKVSSGVDWLSLRLSFESDGVGVNRDELMRCIAEGRKYVRLEDGSFASFDADHVRQLLDREIELMTAANKGGKLPLSQAGRLQELLAQLGASGQVSAGAQEIFRKLSGIDQIEPAKKPRSLKATLRPYQESGLSWLRFIHTISTGGILADDMGLGKTLQTIALLCSVKQDEKELRALIVAPTSVVPNWEREIERFAPSLKTMIWQGADRHEQREELESAEVIITSYPLLRRDEELLSSLDLTYAILDEAQHIKNPTSATAAAARKLKAERRLALTGTPIENRLSEFWSIFHFVSPGLLGSLDKFEERYGRPIDNGDSKAAIRLRSIVHPFILRRTKLEVEKDLPEKIETDQICEMPEEQNAVYQSVLREVRAQIMGEVEKNGLAKSQLHILAGLTRLRQAACDPRLLGLPRVFQEDSSGKLQALRELVEECVSGGHKVLVFSQFTSMLQLIKGALERDGVVLEYLDGSTKDRMERVERFQADPTCSVFLISLKAGGTGLNLTAADTVVHFDPWWNPAAEDQATDRAHRIGQSRVVSVYRLVAKGTIEEKILQLKLKKKELVASVLSEDTGGSKKLT
ncbi:MAG: SNF2-related protein, partial [Polyangiaceae bacterium]|nr:SNF2-related protein [Polyangiaceae bacterium]